MNQVQAERIWLDDREAVSLSELSQCCGMSLSELDELTDYCALMPQNPAMQDRLYSVQWIGPLRAASQLRLDFDLDLFTVAIVLGQLNRIDVLERQVMSLMARLPLQD